MTSKYGYDKLLVNSILNQANTLDRSLNGWNKCLKDSDMKFIRWVILSDSSYEKTINNFTCYINDLVKNHNIKLELVKCTGSNLANLLFNNREKFKKEDMCDVARCMQYVKMEFDLHLMKFQVRLRHINTI